jgi:hypothetical protein
MMAQDKGGNSVGFGDYLVVDIDNGPDEFSFRGVVRVVKLSETPKGIAAIGAFVDLVGNGRVGKVKVDVANSTLVMRSSGEVVA